MEDSTPPPTSTATDQRVKELSTQVEAMREKFTCYDAIEAEVRLMRRMLTQMYPSFPTISMGDSSYSFISPAFADVLHMSPELLDCELWVSTPSGVMLCAQWVYQSCVINIASKDLVVDLILLHMHDFDAILGMNWLSTYYAVVECFEKSVIFHIPGQSKFNFEGDTKVKPLSIIFALQARNMLKRGCIGFLAYMIDSEATNEKLEDIPIVKEFPDLFPEELLGLPLDREIEFSIELFPSTSPISKAPYRKGPS
ncbi:uncharacterized protein LOC142620587 [Castanea sativa]|uniref:uncharacterized protein LOC142620587 n=1 Tax=Castanea sativa TaxID=21020 RepID=UPI003F64AD2F